MVGGLDFGGGRRYCRRASEEALLHFADFSATRALTAAPLAGNTGQLGRLQIKPHRQDTHEWMKANKPLHADRCPATSLTLLGIPSTFPQTTLAPGTVG